MRIIKRESGKMEENEFAGPTPTRGFYLLGTATLTRARQVLNREAQKGNYYCAWGVQGGALISTIAIFLLMLKKKKKISKIILLITVII